MKRFLSFLMLLLPTLTQAAQIDARLAKADVCGRYWIAHINGIRTDLEGASANLTTLRTAYGNAHDGHIINYVLLINPTEGIEIDLADSYQQLIRDFPGVNFVDWLRAVVLGITSGTMTAELAAAITTRALEIWNLEPQRLQQYTDSELLNQLASMRAWYQRNDRLLMVPHSQGNFYANLIHDKLVQGVFTNPVLQVPPQSIAIMGVAIPTTTLRGTHDYVSARNDLPMGAVRAIVPATLPPKPQSLWFSDLTADFPLKHAFRDPYMSVRQPARARILSRMATLLNGLRSIGPFSYQGTPLQYISYAQSSRWQNCGPGPGLPGPCPTPFGPYTTPYLHYPAPRITTGVYRPGSLGELEQVATSTVQACHAALVDSMLLSAMAGRGFQTDVPGCEPRPNEASFLTYPLYSADNLQAFTVPGFPMGNTHWMQAHLMPVCRI